MLGQSFGGFCTVAYLSQAPDGLREAFVTGGLPGLDTTADDVYRRTYQMVAAKNREHYERYPQDVERARRVARALAEAPARLPGGMRLTVAGFQSLGLILGASTGSHTLHYLLEDPFAGGELSDAFRYRVESMLTLAGAPMYALLHEAEYSQGPATGWAAERIRAEFPEFDAARALDSDAPLMFTGEMVYPWMFENDPVLVPLAEAAEAAGPPGGLGAAVRRGPAAGQLGAGGGGDLLQRHVRADGVLAAHGEHDRRAAALGDQRVRARRAAGQPRRGAGPADRAGPRRAVSGPDGRGRPNMAARPATRRAGRAGPSALTAALG